MGVRSTRPAIVRRAASMSASVIAMPQTLLLHQPTAQATAPSNGPCLLRAASLLSICRWIRAEGSQRKAMSDSGPRRIGVSIELKPHAYDPFSNPELFDGVLSRRVVAFLIDLIIISIPVVLAGIFILIFGLLTLGLGWALYVLLSPAAVIWALVYYGMTLGAPASATVGMRVMDLEMRTWYGSPAYFVLGAVHAIVFWISVSFLTPLILLVGFFNERGQRLHDMLVGNVHIHNHDHPQRPRSAYRHVHGAAV